MEDHNRTSGGDQTRHPEFELARWAANHLAPADRAAATVYTSGEHCAMCSAAHGWVGLGRIVIAASSEQLAGWAADLGAAPARVAGSRSTRSSRTSRSRAPCRSSPSASAACSAASSRSKPTDGGPRAADRPCMMRPMVRLLLAVGILLALAAPARADTRTLTLRYGPVHMGGYNVEFPKAAVRHRRSTAT